MGGVLAGHPTLDRRARHIEFPGHGLARQILLMDQPLEFLVELISFYPLHDSPQGGRDGRNRTVDLWFRKPALFPLSYAPIVILAVRPVRAGGGGGVSTSRPWQPPRCGVGGCLFWSHRPSHTLSSGILEPNIGFEPMTYRLRGDCSTTELIRQRHERTNICS